jgi:putative lipoprotein
MFSSSASVIGTVTYRERMAISPNARLEVVLADVSLADAPYTVISQKVISPVGQVPLAFEISYDPARIVENHTYVVMAKIFEGNQLMFINDQSYQVITKQSSRHVQMMLKRVSSN